MATPALDQVIEIAAALIDDGAGRVLLVRKRGTASFMQPGGKIDPGESPLDALRRELREEIGLGIAPDEARYLGSYSAPAAHEPARTVRAQLFHVRSSRAPVLGMEIVEALWLEPGRTADHELAPLTRDHVLPLAAAMCRPGAA